MKRFLSSFSLLLSSLLLLSCQSKIDPDVAKYLSNLTYLTGFENINKASYTSSLTYFDDENYSNQIGEVKENFLIDRTDREKQVYSFETTYEGNQVKPVSGGNLDSLNLVSEKVSANYDQGNDAYKETTTKKALDNDGNEKEDASSEFISSITYINKLTAYLFGDEKTNANGLYYGTFLQSQSRQFSEFMTLSKDGKTLTYDPKPTGINPEEKKYIDLKLTVDQMGMLLTYEATSYDGDNNIYSKFIRNCQYE